MALGESVVEALQEGDVDVVFFDLFPYKLEDLIVGFVMCGLNLSNDGSLLGDKVFDIFEVHLGDSLKIDFLDELIEEFHIFPHFESGIDLFLQLIQLTDLNLTQLEDGQVLQALNLPEFETVILALDVDEFLDDFGGGGLEGLKLL